jgi:cyclin B
MNKQKECKNNNIIESQGPKMDIDVELTNSNNLIGSLSTQASNSTNSINFSIESNNLNICNTNNFFFPVIQNETKYMNQVQTQTQTQIFIKNNETEEKEIFKFNFQQKEESLSFLGEYLNELYSNLLQDEKEIFYKPKIGYMNIQNDINEQMRAILIDWLIEVHYRFKLKAETLFQTVWIIDTYLSILPIVRARLQLLGIAGLLISCKSQEIYYPQLTELIDITDGAYVKDELIEMESHVLKVLNFNILSPTANDFYNIIAKAFNFDKKQYFFGKYFLESSLIDYQMIKYSSSVIAVSCAYIVMKFFGINNYKCLYSSNVIKENCPEKVIKYATREICFLVKNLTQSTLKAVKDKYSLLTIYSFNEKENRIAIAALICAKFTDTETLKKIFSFLRISYNFSPIMVNTDFDKLR